MIKSKKGRVQINGNPNEVIADLTVIMKASRDFFFVNGIDAERVFEFAKENSLLSAEELEAEENEDGGSDGEG